MSEFQVSIDTINGKPCIEHLDDCFDLQIMGRYGFIIQTGPKSFKAGIDKARQFNKRMPNVKLFVNARRGEEVWLEFETKDFDSVHKAILVPRKLENQLELAKRFNTPF